MGRGDGSSSAGSDRCSHAGIWWAGESRGLTGCCLEVWPESHWPGFALRQADVFQSYAACSVYVIRFMNPLLQR